MILLCISGFDTLQGGGGLLCTGTLLPWVHKILHDHELESTIQSIVNLDYVYSTDVRTGLMTHKLTKHAVTILNINLNMQFSYSGD